MQKSHRGGALKRGPWPKKSEIKNFTKVNFVCPKRKAETKIWPQSFACKPKNRTKLYQFREKI